MHAARRRDADRYHEQTNAAMESCLFSAVIGGALCEGKCITGCFWKGEAHTAPLSSTILKLTWPYCQESVLMFAKERIKSNETGQSVVVAFVRPERLCGTEGCQNSSPWTIGWTFSNYHCQGAVSVIACCGLLPIVTPWREFSMGLVVDQVRIWR